jgi:hypothetical protein
MTFDLRIITVEYGEWTLWASLLLSTSLAVLLGVAVGRCVAAASNIWLRWLGGAVAAGALWFGMALVAFMAFQLLFMAANGGASVCTVLVGRALIVPSIVVVGSQCMGWWMARRAEDARGRPTKG